MEDKDKDNKHLNALSNAVSRGAMSSQALDFLDEHLKLLAEAVDKRIFIAMNKAEVVDTNVLLQKAYPSVGTYCDR